MNLRHLRNATALLSFAGHRLVIDPMLAEPGSLPGFKIFGGGRRPNPLVALPPAAPAALAGATGVLLTHRHPDHFDRAGLAWARQRNLPVWASPVDAAKLRRKGLDVRAIGSTLLGAAIEIVPTAHGRGLLGRLMGGASGYYLAYPGEPSLYLTSDAVLTDALLAAVDRLRPDVIVAPAGAANLGAGGDILFSVDELVTLARRAPGRVVFNHLEALDHCPTTRAGLRARMQAEGLAEKVSIPADGEELRFERPGATPGGAEERRFERPGAATAAAAQGRSSVAPETEQSTP
jgi:L-ascorbate metabolism protein UlaG (beta-lactamase superfamily)